MILLKKETLVTKAQALPGRAEPAADNPVLVPLAHYVNTHPVSGPFPRGLECLYFALGCFWGAERLFWQLSGVYSTAVGYAGGFTPNPSYDEVCTGLTGHTEVVQVVYDPAKIGLEELLTVFWEAHDPSQGMRQGNDKGSQYRSAIYTSTEKQLSLAVESKQRYQTGLHKAGFGDITSEVHSVAVFYYAEGYHQQYLAKNPQGYCGLAGTGVKCIL